MTRFFQRLFDRGVPELPPASNAPKPHLRQGIYLLPTLFTVGNMSLGFYSLVKSTLGEFSAAATAIIFGHVLDIMDGRVARWTKTSSKFGIELDSLSDLVTFCVAPAFMMYQLVLHENRVWGFPIALLFVICGALRLAKFNVKAHLEEGKGPYFVGLPSPAAGGMLAIFTLLYEIMDLGKPVRTMKVVMSQVPVLYQLVPVVMLLLSLLMVSNVQFTTFKNFNLLRPRTMRSLVLTVLVLLMAYVYPQNMVFIFYVSYIAWGLVEYFIFRTHRAGYESGKFAAYQKDNYGK